MVTPVTIGTTAVTVLPANTRRYSVRFQNTGASTLYFVRQISTTVANVPTITNYEFLLGPGGATEINEAYTETRSTAQFNVVSSAAGGTLAVLETIK
jgi:hypothetical protein